MSHMQPSFRYGLWLKFSGHQGTEFVYADDFGTVLRPGRVLSADDEEFQSLFGEMKEYVEFGDPESVEAVEGWGARMTAPGFLDCTEWCVFPTKREAEAYVYEYYGDSDDEAT